MEDSHKIEVSWQGLWQFKILSISLIWIINILVTSSANLPAIMVTSNISAGEIVCPGDTIIFTCTTRESAIISWTGNDYVGDQVGFNTADMIGETRLGSADPNTIATLINNTVDNTTRILVSQLRIIVSTTSLNQSVICVHNSNGIREPTIFQVIVDPDRPRVTAHLTGDPMRGCTLHISWIIPDITAIRDITHFMIYIDGVNVYNQTNSNDEAFLSFSYFVRSCGPHNASVSIVNCCDRAGPLSPTVIIVSPDPVVCEDIVCEENAIIDSASMCLEAPFIALFVLAMVGMIASVGLNMYLIYFKIIKIKINYKKDISAHEVHKLP